MQTINSPLVSIIVPIYNVEQYLRKCLDSIIMQTMEDFEVILINDGSTQNEEKICLEYQNKDKRFKYFFKENGGVSSARNLGIDKAKGKYLSFIDPDDWLDDNFYEAFFEEDLEKYFVVQDIKRITSSKIFSNYQGYNNEIYTLPKDYKLILANYKLTQGYLFNKLFIREIVERENLRFNEELIICEDEIFYFNYFLLLDKIKFISASGYNYLDREESATKKTPSFNSEFLHVKETFKIINALEKKSNKEQIKDYKKNNIINIYNYLIRGTIYRNNYIKKDRIKFLKEVNLEFGKELELVKPDTFLKKIDYFLLKNKLYNILDCLLLLKTKYN